jgi:alpha-beta hydrolase superfamily lysophospholipase
LDGFIVRRGFDVFLLDVRGYGRSTRPPAMDAPPEAKPPFATTEDARADVAAVAAHIRQLRGIERPSFRRVIGVPAGSRSIPLRTTDR